jgi:hypothetical protein
LARSGASPHGSALDHLNGVYDDFSLAIDCVFRSGRSLGTGDGDVRFADESELRGIEQDIAEQASNLMR